MDSMDQDEIAAVMRELLERYPRVRIWTEVLPRDGLHWCASGNPNPVVLMSADLEKFVAWLGECATGHRLDDERGLCAYVHPGPCDHPAEGTDDR